MQSPLIGTLATSWLAVFCNRFLFDENSGNAVPSSPNLGFPGDQDPVLRRVFRVDNVRPRQNAECVPERPYRGDGYVALYGLDNAHAHHSQEYQPPDI